MDLSDLARRLTGAPEVTVRTYHRGPELAQQIWVAGLYGYRLHRHDPGTLPSLTGPSLHLVLDPDPSAQQRAAWMRRPDLRPGAPSPVPWAVNQAGRWPLLWTPPGWPPGHGPLLPPPEQLPYPPVTPWRTRLSPGNLVLLAAFTALVRLLAMLGVTKTGRPVSLAWWDAVTIAIVVALLAAALAARRIRDRARRLTTGHTPTSHPPTSGEGHRR
ncbi:hypothetical protein [Kitasatospora sp. NPDC093679]|uniref:hypothetical protein n=1 Tax=Kitasatospora sp. NPDC093679 TaxID=3154983 RepID=UPI00343C08A5